MPQEVALHLEFTIKEMLYYFGKLYLIGDDKLNERIRDLSDYLSISKEIMNSKIGDLSGGEQRRVSLASTLIHEPRLLILDEPTVGVDPLLRSKIWAKLVEMTIKLKTTIIITTHYIEEARHADSVGFMISGRILEEGHPHELMVKYREKSLENVFLTLVTKQVSEGCKVVENCNSNTINSEDDANNNEISKSELKSDSRKNDYKNWFLILFVLIWKFNLKTIRHPEVLCFLLLQSFVSLPAAYYAIASIKGLKITVINEENPPKMSRIFLNHINNQVINLEYANKSEFNYVLNRIKKLEIHALLHIPANFSINYAKKVFIADHESDNDEEWFEFQNSVDDDIIDGGKMMLYRDVSSLIITRIIESTLTIALNDSFAEMMNSINKNPKVNPTLRDYSPVKGSWNIEDSFGRIGEMLPGMIVVISSVNGLIFGFLSFFFEKMDSMYIRNRLANVTKMHHVVAIILSQIPLLLFQSFISFLMIVLWFGLEFKGSVLLETGLIIISLINGLLIGIIFSFLIIELLPFTMYAVFYMNATIILSGQLWPVECIPYYLSFFKYLVIPFWMRSVTDVMKGENIFHKNVHNSIYFMIAYISVLLIIISKLEPITKK